MTGDQENREVDMLYGQSYSQKAVTDASIPDNGVEEAQGKSENLDPPTPQKDK